MPHAYAEDQLVEQPAIGLRAELGWTTVSAVERLNPSLPPEIIRAAGISGKSRGSLGGEDTVLSEVTAVKKELDLNEWLAARCCKSLISSRFLFE